MYRNLNELRKSPVHSLDRRVGFLEQVFFDDLTWTVRYVVVHLDRGPDGTRRRVQLHPSAVDLVDDSTGEIVLGISSAQVQSSPDADMDMPVSRQKQIEFERLRGWYPLWTGSLPHGYGYVPLSLVEAVMEEKNRLRHQGDAHLRSSSEVIGYRLLAPEGPVGRVSDFIIDDASWLVSFVEVRTARWPRKKDILLYPVSITDVSWEKRSVTTTIAARAIREAPAFESTEALSPRYKAMLRARFGF